MVLLEAGDLAVGTSSRSGKTMHGGLRYLEQLNFSLVFGALRERDLTIKTLAPHLVSHEPFLYPLRHQWEKPYVGSGVGLYDAMATMSRRTGGAPHARYLGRRAVQRAAPGLDPEVVIAGLQYPDGRMDDARHTLAVARTAAAYGAHVITRAPVTGVRTAADGRVTGVTAEDRESGGELRRDGPRGGQRGGRVGGGDPAARGREHVHRRAGEGRAPARPERSVRVDDGRPGPRRGFGDRSAQVVRALAAGHDGHRRTKATRPTRR